MKDFKKNNCRLCHKTFCCEICREKHEKKIHNVNLSCGICIYGVMFARNIDDALIMHFQNNHWPLHCVYCRKIFETTSDFKLHTKCPRFKSKSNQNPVTPSNQQENGLDPSPIQGSFQKSIITASNTLLIATGNNTTNHMTTSTPMHHTINENGLLENLSSDITPLDSQAKHNENSSTFQNTPEVDEPKKTHEKRKVTFCGTPIPEKIKKTSDFAGTKEFKYLVIKENCCALSLSNSSNSPSSSNESDKNLQNNNEFRTLKIKRQEENYSNESSILKNQKHIVLDEEQNVNKEAENLTLWKSALNSSPQTEPYSSEINDDKSNQEDIGNNEQETQHDSEDRIKDSLNKQEHTSNISEIEDKQNYENVGTVVNYLLPSPPTEVDCFHTPLGKIEPSCKDQLQICVVDTPKTVNCRIHQPLYCSDGLEATEKNVCRNGQLHSHNTKESNKSNECKDLVVYDGSRKYLQPRTSLPKIDESDYSTPLCKIRCCVILEQSRSYIKNNQCINNICTANACYNRSLLDKSEQNTSSCFHYCLNQTEKFIHHSQDFHGEKVNRTGGIWSSMTNLVRTVIHTFSSQVETPCLEPRSLKRSKPDEETSQSDQPHIKRMKLTDIRCRPNIRELNPSYKIKFSTKESTADKATQTDRYLF